MEKLDPVGRPMPVLVVLLWGSFVLMLLSGIFYGLGLPESWARAMFLATVVVWTFLGVALVVQGWSETRELARGSSSGTPGEGKEDAT